MTLRKNKEVNDVIEHKAYECEFCGREFEHDEREVALEHEACCPANPKLKQCSSCDSGKIIVRYDCKYIQCMALRPINGTCGCWREKKGVT